MNKPVYLSKTLWMNLVLAIAAFFPVVQVYIAAHPEAVALFFVGVNVVLRLVTKTGVQLYDGNS